MSHPSKDIISSKGRELAGRKIALLVTSSVASFKAPEIARELMRHGADVYAVTSPSTEKMIGADLLEWATGNPVVTHLTGKLEHIALGGKSEGHADLVLVAPATANTIGKLASGIDDTPVTTVAATAIGSRIPVVIAPAMHEPLYDHPIVQENISRLKKTDPDLVFAAGAPTDYRPVTVAPKKIKTREKPQINLELRATPKILEEIRKASPKTFLVAFKTEHKVSNEELIDEAFKIIHEKNADLVAANDVGLEGVGFQADTNELYVVDGRKKVVHIPLAEKREVARQLVDLAVKRMRD